jgi:hypothetical protein
VLSASQRGVTREGHTHERRRRALVAIAFSLIALTVIHDLDHLRQGRALAVELYVVAVLALASTGSTLALLIVRHPLAETAAVVVGLATVVGVSIVHVAPPRPLLSDSYAAARADALSWVIIAAMVLVGLLLALTALPGRRGQGSRLDGVRG